MGYGWFITHVYCFLCGNKDGLCGPSHHTCVIFWCIEGLIDYKFTLIHFVFDLSGLSRGFSLVSLNSILILESLPNILFLIFRYGIMGRVLLPFC